MLSKTTGLRAAWYIFGAGLKQHEAASLLGLSRPKTNRLISSIRSTNNIHYTIGGNPEELLSLEKKLCQVFSLDSCMVCGTGGKADPYYEIGGTTLIQAGAHKLQSMISKLNKPSVGLGKSRTIRAVVENLKLPYSEEYSWVALHGCLGASFETNPFEIIEDLCNKLGGEGYLLPAPAIVKTPGEARAALRGQEIQHILSIVKKAPLYTFSIGAIHNIKHIKTIFGLSDSEIEALTKAGAVGDILGHFIDSKGDSIIGPAAPFPISISLSQLKKKKRLVVAGGRYKAEAILSSLRGGYISDLVTDIKTAKQILVGIKI